MITKRKAKLKRKTVVSTENPVTIQ